MKAKTRKSASKRIKRTKNKLMIQKSCKRHLLVNKSKRQKRKNMLDAPTTHKKHFTRLLPNG